MDRPLVVTLPKFQFKTPDLARKISGLHSDLILHERKLILDRLHARRQLVHLLNDTRPTIGVLWHGLGSLRRSIGKTGSTRADGC